MASPLEPSLDFRLHALPRCTVIRHLDTNFAHCFSLRERSPFLSWKDNSPHWLANAKAFRFYIGPDSRSFLPRTSSVRCILTTLITAGSQVHASWRMTEWMLCLSSHTYLYFPTSGMGSSAHISTLSSCSPSESSHACIWFESGPSSLFSGRLKDCSCAAPWRLRLGCDNKLIFARRDGDGLFHLVANDLALESHEGRIVSVSNELIFTLAC